MKNYKRIISAIITGVLLAGLTGCGQATTSETTSSADTLADKNISAENTELKKERIGAPGTDGKPALENLSIAADKGFLEEELNAVGYSAEITAFTGAGPAINEAYASKALDIAIYGDLPALTAYSRGINTKLFGIANGQMDAGIIAGNNSGISTPKDLEGKKAIVGTGTYFQEYWEHLRLSRESS